MEKFPVGKKFVISDGSGIDSGLIVTIIHPKMIKTDYDGIPVNTVTSDYKRVDWTKEVAIRLPSGGLRTMFKNRLLNL